ncbi:class I SAM-dependent methyltransferase [Nocardia panacis]|uniref:Class I SAM-dependent methyltransferase n=1 Tax=Nocardia panacis TaxID=2340916 RepID=A0A3A4K988_9NOCA|nr:class I SAM-dependent methyltransferase [Nocardia panacis]RJO69934.1 class I SAM-dependent methyltransferase [Nocardia panacis]
MPIQQSSWSNLEPHRQRAIAESYGVDAARYDRTRPHYPEQMVQRIVAATPGPDVLDIGCGTGISSRQFAAAGCRVLGVDADARMAESARRLAIATEVARFEEWDPRERTFDAVIAGQAWHWVDPVAGAAKAARILRRSGRIALFWNVFQPPTELAEAFAASYRRVLPDLPAMPARPAAELYEPMLTMADNGLRATGAFAEAERWTWEWQQRYTRDEWLDQVPTHGSSTQLSPQDLRTVLIDIGAAIDAAGGEFVCDYTTVVLTAITE